MRQKDRAMATISDLEQRITAAFTRIVAGVEALTAAAPPVHPPDTDMTADMSTELAAVLSDLDEERMAHAQLNERVKMLNDQGNTRQQALVAEVDRLTRHTDTQGLDLQRLRSSVTQLREDLRRLREAAEQGMADPGLINRAMQAELEALRATRAAEASEMSDILAALGPIVEAEEMRAHA